MVVSLLKQDARYSNWTDAVQTGPPARDASTGPARDASTRPARVASPRSSVMHSRGASPQYQCGASSGTQHAVRLPELDAAHRPEHIFTLEPDHNTRFVPVKPSRSVRRACVEGASGESEENSASDPRTRSTTALQSTADSVLRFTTHAVGPSPPSGYTQRRFELSDIDGDVHVDLLIQLDGKCQRSGARLPRAVRDCLERCAFPSGGMRSLPAVHDPFHALRDPSRIGT